MLLLFASCALVPIWSVSLFSFRYLYFLLSAFSKLPKEPEGDFYRGVGQDAVQARCSKLNRQWSWTNRTSSIHHFWAISFVYITAANNPMPSQPRDNSWHIELNIAHAIKYNAIVRPFCIAHLHCTWIITELLRQIFYLALMSTVLYNNNLAHAVCNMIRNPALLLHCSGSLLAKTLHLRQMVKKHYLPGTQLVWSGITSTSRWFLVAHWHTSRRIC